MTYLLSLADIARSTGAPVVEVDGWKSRGHGPMVDVKTIMCHHTAGAVTGDMPSLRILRDGTSRLAGPLAHYGLARSGTIYVIAAGKCYHAGQVRDASYANEHAIGIEAENVGDSIDPWSPTQMRSYIRLCAALGVAFKLGSDRVVGHKEACAPPGRKIDPAGIDMDPFRALVNRRMGEIRASRDAPRRYFTLARILRADVTPLMKGGDVRAVQHRLLALGYRLPAWGADSVYGDESKNAVRRFQLNHRLSVDGRVGPNTTRALGGTWTGA